MTEAFDLPQEDTNIWKIDEEILHDIENFT